MLSEPGSRSRIEGRRTEVSPSKVERGVFTIDLYQTFALSGCTRLPERPLPTRSGHSGSTIAHSWLNDRFRPKADVHAGAKTLVADAGLLDLLPIPQRIDHQLKSRRRLLSAWIIQMIAGIGRAPIGKDPHESTGVEM